MERATLDGATHVTVDGITIHAPGVEGQVAVARGSALPAAAEAQRRGTARGDAAAGAPYAADSRSGSRSGLSPELGRALRRQGMRTARTLVIDGVRPARRGVAEPITLTTQRPRTGRAQVLLVVQDGIATWHHSRESQVEPAAVRRGRRGPAASAAPSRRLTYEVPQLAEPGRVTRAGLIPVGPIIKVITFPISHVIGEAARFTARRWDRSHHPPLLRTWQADGAFTELGDADWPRLAAGRALLFIHGTFSTTTGGFGALPLDARVELHRRYGGRVLAYDHPTIADDAAVNARDFYALVGDHGLDLDIVCHSRGGLVARSIAERPGSLSTLGRNTRVHQIVLVACVNNGTVLADVPRWGAMVDRYTTLLTLLPVPGAAQTLEAVLAVVKSIAVETAHDLEGLSSMAPGSAFLRQLNVAGTQPEQATYRAITSNFEPRDPDLLAWLRNRGRDAIFGEAPNDMLVAVESMTGPNGSDRFPISPANVVGFGPADAIEHSMYFGQARTAGAFLAWLTGH
jgi:hypothetical protein